MYLEQQVCSLDLAKELKELGVKQESLFWWVSHVNGNQLIHDYDKNDWIKGVWDTRVSAYTVAELGEMLPFSIKFKKHVCYLNCEKNIPDYGGWICSYESSDIIRPTMKTEIFTADTEADARAAMFVYLLKNGLLKVEDINS
jgi:hypothetical protein